MKKNSLPVTALLTLFIIISGFQYDARAQSKWSGSLTLTQKFVGETGKSDRHVEVSFTNALPTLYRNDPTTDLDFTDDKGTGTANYHGEFIIGGKLVSTTDCRGSGQTELHEVVIDPEDSTYRIHAIGPACNGISVDLLPGGTTQPFGPELTDIIVSSKASGGVNQTVLTGTETTVSDVAGVGKVTTTISWGLWRGPIDAILIVSPVDYDNWKPSATADELRKGNAMSVNLKVQKRNGGDSPFRVARFELKLNNTSTEKGTTLNFPLEPSRVQLPDLRLLPDGIPESNEADQSIEINSTDGKTGYFLIGSYDGGGWTNLTAVAVLEGGIRIEGTLLTPSGVKDIPIPKRNPNSKIAVKWLNENGNPGETDDKEQSTGTTNIGDGLSAYEEYRGFIAYTGSGGTLQKPEFVRLDPKIKELGIQVKKGEYSLFAEGINWFKIASNVTPVIFSENEIPADRILNKNKGHANVYEQYVLKVENGPVPGSGVGMNEPIRRLRGVPKQSDRIVIDIQKIIDNYQHDVDAGRAGNEVVPYTYLEKLDNTVAHEIGHGVNLIHHGDEMGPYSTVAPACTPANPCYTTYRIYDHHGIEIRNRPIPLENAGAVGSEESGDLSCIMAYTGMYQWAYRLIQREHYYYYVTFQPVGKRLCTSTAGTGINANNKYFGNAEDGNCRGQIKLRD